MLASAYRRFQPGNEKSSARNLRIIKANPYAWINAVITTWIFILSLKKAKKEIKQNTNVIYSLKVLLSYDKKALWRGVDLSRRRRQENIDEHIM